jgi:hypothetical protein
MKLFVAAAPILLAIVCMSAATKAMETGNALVGVFVFLIFVVPAALLALKICLD